MQCGCFWSSLLSLSTICPENTITDQRVPFFNQEAVSICLCWCVSMAYSFKQFPFSSGCVTHFFQRTYLINVSIFVNLSLSGRRHHYLVLGLSSDPTTETVPFYPRCIIQTIIRFVCRVLCFTLPSMITHGKRHSTNLTSNRNQESRTVNKVD